MSSPYQILDNRPLDHWKVTELKEELKRRKLTTKGLKEDLVKRLDEAVRIERANAQIERANAQKDVDNGLNGDPQDVVPVKSIDTNPIPVEGIVDDGHKKTEKVDVAPIQVDINDSAAALVQGNIQEGYVLVDKDSAAVEEKLVVHSTTVETSISVAEFVVPDVTETEQDLQKTETQEENGDPKPPLENEDSKPQLANEDSKPQLENEDSKPQLANEDSKPQLESDTSKPLLESDDSKPQLESENSKPQLENVCSNSTSGDVMLNPSAPNNQVSEVSPILGSQVKYDSISTDSVSINEKIELKDNIIADHVKLELDVIKPEMVEPSSSTVVPVGGDSHPMDVEEPHESKASVGEKDEDNDNNADFSKKNDSVDVGYSEKLNLDRSSGDDSMEEDMLESKQIDSKYNSDDVGDRIEKIDVSVAKEEESHVDVVGDDFSADKKDDHVENKDRPTAIAEKRKLNDQALGGNNEPQKRQRRWNSESLKVPEPQSSNITSITPKDNFQSGAPKRNFSRSDSTVSEDATKERVVPPSPKAPSSSLRIDRFLRPFTLKAVQELLGKTGNVTSFWMDHIKTHCYVTYSSVEEAIKTRNAVYNLQWPPNGGRLLVAEFVDAQEVKTRVETPQTPQTPQTPAASANLGPPVSSIPPNLQQPSPRLHKQQQQQVPPPPSLPPPPPQLSNTPPARERLPPPPPLAEKLDPPIVTLDDLFRKTKATPRIYYLPLAEEQVEAKLAMQGKNKRQ